MFVNRQLNLKVKIVADDVTFASLRLLKLP